MSPSVILIWFLDVLGSDAKNWIIFSIYLQSAHREREEAGNKVFRIILKSVSVEDDNCVGDEVNVLWDASKLTLQVFEDAGLDDFGVDIRIVTPIAIAGRNRTERIVDKLLKLLQHRLSIGGHHKRTMNKWTNEQTIDEVQKMGVGDACAPLSLVPYTEGEQVQLARGKRDKLRLLGNPPLFSSPRPG